MTESSRDESKASKPYEVFVISPIGKIGTEAHRQALLALNYIIKKALPEVGWHVMRADFEESPDSITQKVIDRILRADLIVADLTGHNPNVFYELAIAHSFGRPVVTLTTEGFEPPFDVADQRCIFYDLANPESVYDAQEKLLARAEHALANPDELRTPISEHAQIVTISRSAAAADEGSPAGFYQAVLERLDAVEGSLRKLRVDNAKRRIDGVPRVVAPASITFGTAFRSVNELVKERQRIESTPVSERTKEEANLLREIQSVFNDSNLTTHLGGANN